MFRQPQCPRCHSDKVEHYKDYETAHNGSRTLHVCTVCREVFSETRGTFLEGLQKPISMIVNVFKARAEGMALNAVCRLFEISKNTVLNWERRFAGIKGALLLYALTQTFLSQFIEGDERYTKIGRNKPVEECEGWTLILMERASRFMWELTCGEKDRELFLSAIQRVKKIIACTGDVTLVTDGERRYGNILFEICHEVMRDGRRGRPPKVLPKGVKVRIKNKGSRAHQRGRRRPKYETPHREHPHTPQNLETIDIHANHVEALNASLRRRHSAYRRKTNT